MQISSYPNVFALGHRALEGLFNGPVRVEEKVDGSQISFGHTAPTGSLFVRSKGRDQTDNPDTMFRKAAHEISIRYDDLTPGWVYRGEYLEKPKHNTLAYSRVPRSNIVIFDIENEQGRILAPIERNAEATRLGFEAVPVFYVGEISDQVFLNNLIQEALQRKSFLGGQKIEGVVVKNPNVFGLDKKWLIGKFVSEAFKEVHSKDWRERNPTQGDFITQLAEQYQTPARWQKAVLHLRENGQLTGSPQDIGPLIKEVNEDIVKECKDEIAQKLFNHFYGRTINKIVTRGLPEWYKRQLLEQSFEEAA